MLHWYSKVKHDDHDSICLSVYNQHMLPHDGSHWDILTGKSTCLTNPILNTHEVHEVLGRYTSMKEGNHSIESHDHSLITKVDGTEITIEHLINHTGYQSVFGYYVYDLDSSILTREILHSADVKFIDDHFDSMDFGSDILFRTILFPRVGGRKDKIVFSVGDTIKLIAPESFRSDPNDIYKFKINIGIGFFIIPNGWSIINNPDKNKDMYKSMFSKIVYSDPVLNWGNTLSSIILSDKKHEDGISTKNLIAFSDAFIPENSGLPQQNVYPMDLIFYTKMTSITDNSHLLLIPNIILYPIVSKTTFEFDYHGFYLQLNQTDVTAIRNIMLMRDGNIHITHFIQIANKETLKVLYSIFTELFVSESNSKLSIHGNILKITVPLLKLTSTKKHYLVFSSIKNDEEHEKHNELHELFKKSYILDRTHVREWIEIVHEPYKKNIITIDNDGTYRVKIESKGKIDNKDRKQKITEPISAVSKLTIIEPTIIQPTIIDTKEIKEEKVPVSEPHIIPKLEHKHSESNTFTYDKQKEHKIIHHKHSGSKTDKSDKPSKELKELKQSELLIMRVLKNPSYVAYILLCFVVIMMAKMLITLFR